MKDLDYIDEDLLDGADKIAEMSDKEIVASTLGANNQNALANYQMAMLLKLKGETSSLNNNIKKFSKASAFSSWAMIILTVIIAILTAILLFK